MPDSNKRAPMKFEKGVFSMSAPGKRSPGGLAKKIQESFFSREIYRGYASVVTLLILWEAGAKLGMPIIKNIPPLTSVLDAFRQVIFDSSYWGSWGTSFNRICIGYIAAQIIGIPLGLLMGTSRFFREMTLPVFEVLRPIPPLAWVPAAAIFWPTREISIIFVTFLGAFFVLILDIVGGARAIDPRYIRAATSLGSRRKDILWRIVFPATLPSIIVGMTVGIGVAWNTVVAAEMIASRSGLGFMTWRSYVTLSYPLIVVGMISIGIADCISSGIIRFLGARITPWLRTDMPANVL
jgi:NitT/TauT family transport system permease protein